jgi:predicted GH43/DUF377 family glycosyl hydrolase
VNGFCTNILDGLFNQHVPNTRDLELDLQVNKSLDISVVASLTTIPPRCAELKLTLNSLIPQVDHIYLGVAETYVRFGSYSLPEYLRQEPYSSCVTIVTGPDKGPATKYLGALSKIPSNTWVFFCDDDQEYNSHLISTMLQSVSQIAVYQNHFRTIQRETSGGLVHGYVGNLINVSLLRDLPSFPFPPSARFVDDQWMSMYCHFNNIPILPTLAESYDQIFAVLHNDHEKTGVNSLSRLTNREEKIRELENFFGVQFSKNLNQFKTNSLSSKNAPVEIYLSEGSILGMGWFGVENDRHRSFRWSGGLSEVEMSSDAPNTVIFFAGTKVPDREIRFYADGGLMYQLTTVKGWNYYIIPLKTCDRLTIVSQTFCPGDGDSRELGMMVSKILLAESSVTEACVLSKLPELEIVKAASLHGTSIDKSGRVLVSSRKKQKSWYDDAPSVFVQTGFRIGVFDLGYSESRVFLNPAIYENNGLFLAVRQSDRVENHLFGINKIKLYSLDDNLRIVEAINAVIQDRFIGEQYEDPRVLVTDEQVYVSCCNYVLGDPYNSQQVLLEFDKEQTFSRTITPEYGGNNTKGSNTDKMEKNWTWFSKNDLLYSVYLMSPHTVVQFTENGSPVTAYKTYSHVVDQWQYGECRMGSNPVLVDGLYYNFFHSSLPLRDRRIYFMGAYTFESEPPFRIVHLTPEPILCGSSQDINNFDNQWVIFPCGAVLIDSEWIVSFGINDERCGWVRIPHEKLLSSLSQGD